MAAFAFSPAYNIVLSLLVDIFNSYTSQRRLLTLEDGPV